MTRTFIALSLPHDVRAHLSGLSGGIPGAKWIKADNYHITLRFLGELDRHALEDVNDALEGISAPAFDLMLEGVGQFGGDKARSLWAGVERSPALMHLHDKIESALSRIGLPHDTRKFSPHVTLARLKDVSPERIGSFLADNGLFRTGPVHFDRFTLYASYTGGEASVYESMQDYPLQQYGF